MLRLKKISFQSKILLLQTKLFKINKKRTSTAMQRNAFKNGELKERMLNHLLWSLRITKREFSESINLDILL